MKRFYPSTILFVLLLTALIKPQAEVLPIIDDIEHQPFVASSLRLNEALTFLGSGLSNDDATQLDALRQQAPSAEITRQIQDILDPYCLAMVNINPESRVKVFQGEAAPVLVQNGWKSYLIKVHNEAHTNAELQVESPNSEPLLHRSSGRPNVKDENVLMPGEVANRFLEAFMYTRRPMKKTLSGIGLEYAILQLYTKDVGRREARIGFNIGQGSQDIGFRNTIDILFDCQPAVEVVFRVKDHDGEPAMASFVITDDIERILSDDNTAPFPRDYRLNMARRRNWESRPANDTGIYPPKLTGIYPLPSRRLASDEHYPDFFFHPQVYRQDGEMVQLPPGNYRVDFTRGPEYIPQSKVINVPDEAKSIEVVFQLERWIHMRERGWISGDHHVHAAGCSHYESPMEGVSPASMFRQALGEDLNVACVLTWGPCWYFQKGFFEGKDHSLSNEESIMRYDVEVSGFPSSHAGHLCLLRLKEDDYPGTTKIEEWPSYTLPVLQWGKEQGAIVGYSHSGWGLEPMEPTEELPNYVMAKFDGIGANEYIVTVAHDACDFISSVDTPAPWELNIWYHTLNCGFRATISGETDFPCIYDDRVGLGRLYAKLDDLNFDAFAESIKDGHTYVTDGKSHIFDFEVDGQDQAVNSERKLRRGKNVRITANVAAYLPEEQDAVGAVIAGRSLASQPYWDIERARVGKSRKVPVELVVNGEPVETVEVEADGDIHKVSFRHEIDESSWVALRIYPSAHTNPMYVIVDDKPIRANKRSAEWCRAAVDRCWEMKSPRIRESEMNEARAAYDYAREVYDKIIAEHM